MLPVECQRETLGAFERATGKPVVLAADQKLPHDAVIKIATGSAPAHVLKYRPTSERELPYLVCFQCEMALRAVLAPRDERFNVASTPATYTSVRKLVEERNPSWRGSLPDHVVDEYTRMITDGLGTQLRSVPVGMRVDRQIHDQQLPLRPMQRMVVERQLQESAGILNPTVRENVPDLIFHASAGMNAATALFWSRLWGDDRFLVPYKLSGLVATGDKLVSFLDSIPGDRMHDRELVSGWAETLGVSHLFLVGPVGL